MPTAFVPLKFVVIEISIVDHFCDLRDSFVLNSESPYQRLKSAIVSVMREIAVQHVEREHARGLAVRSDSKANFAFGSMDLRISQAEPTRSISGRGRVQPDSAAKISLTRAVGCGFDLELSSLQFLQNHLRDLSLSGCQKNLSALISRNCFRMRPRLPPKFEVRLGTCNERAKHFPK